MPASSPRFLGTVVRYAHLDGEVHAAQGGEAVACWLTPGDTAVTPARIFRTGGFPTPLKLGVAPFLCLVDLRTYLGEMNARHASEPRLFPNWTKKLR